MMNEKIRVNGAIGMAINDLTSQRSKGFFDGARAMMTALETMSADERSQALAHKNQQRIVALLLESERRQQVRRQREARLLVDYYPIDREQLRAFVFDVPAVDVSTGRAMDDEGNYLEDENFNLLPGKTNPGWPIYIVYQYVTDQKISRSEYEALSAKEKRDYDYVRTLIVTSSLGKPALEVRSSNYELVAELIRRDILVGDPEVNRRYEAMVSRVYLGNMEANVSDEFYFHANTIQQALMEVRERPNVLAPYHKHIVKAMAESATFKEHCGETAPNVRGIDGQIITSVQEICDAVITRLARMKLEEIMPKAQETDAEGSNEDNTNN